MTTCLKRKLLLLPSTLTSGNLVSTTSAVVGWRAGSSPYKLGKHTRDPSRIWASTLGAWKGGGRGRQDRDKKKVERRIEEMQIIREECQFVLYSGVMLCCLQLNKVFLCFLH